MYTTLNKIRRCNPCKRGWAKLLAHLGKKGPDNEPLSLAVILQSNGLSDALWCLRAVDGYDREMRLFAVKCVRRVQHLLKDQRSLHALNVAEAYANGGSCPAELAQARDAALQRAREFGNWMKNGEEGAAAAAAAAWAVTWDDPFEATLACDWIRFDSDSRFQEERTFQKGLFVEMCSSESEED